jgi:succinoglycan biosynthesis transport protein ExoP
MNTRRATDPPPPTTLSPRDVMNALSEHPLRWMLPLVLCTTLGVLYAYLKPATWEATQALLVRDEAAGKATRPGRFSAVEEMKTAQETVLELIKSRTVLAGALTAVGPPANEPAPEHWPSDRTVESLEQAIKITPPKGAEFGKTEVFYLKVQAGDPARAIALDGAICRQLEKQFDDLRFQKYQGVIDELTKTVSLAQADLDASTEALSAVERAAGPDLAELRILNETPSNESGLRRQAGEIETELRTYRGSVNSNQELLKLLQSSLDDPGRLLASPGRLLESQPALRRLKDGLVDAQLRTAQLLGNMAETHPAVTAARASEQEISRQLHDEISIAIKGLEVDRGLAKERVERLEEQRQNVQSRLVHLAEIRARYANLATTTRHRGEILKTAQQELAEARAGQAGAHTASLITLIGHADVGSRPVGPGKSVILLASMFGGLLMGAGIVFLTVMPEAGARRAAAVDAPIAKSTNETAVIEPVAAEATKTPPLAAAVLDCCAVAPAATGCSAQRSSMSRSAPLWAADPPTFPENSLPTRQRAPETVAAAPTRPTSPTPRSPVAAGSLSLRQALDRVFPGPTAKN